MPISPADQQEFSDADWRVVDNADQSKKLKFEVGGLTTATTRTATWPDKSGTVAMTSDITSSPAATQTDQESASSNTVFITPAVQQFHPSAVKFWALATAAGALTSSFNLTSVTDTGAGDILFTIATDFSSTGWAPLMGANGNIGTSATASTSKYVFITAITASTIEILTKNGSAGTLVDPNNPYSVAGMGDQ